MVKRTINILIYTACMEYCIQCHRLFVKIKVKIPRKFHNYEAQPSRSTNRRRDEEQTKTKQTPHMKPPMYKEELRQRSRFVRSVGKILGWWVRGKGDLNQVYSGETSLLIYSSRIIGGKFGP